MNNKAKTIRILLAALLAAMFAASGVLTIATALGIPLAGGAMAGITWAGIWAAALCGLAASSTPGMVIAAVLFAASGGLWALSNARRFGALSAFLTLWNGQTVEAGVAAQGGGLFFTAAALAMGAVFFALLYRRELSSLAVMLLLAMLIGSHAMSETASIAATVPGLVAAASAFALTGGVQRDASAPRVLVPSVLAVAVALMLLPGGRATWAPLEEAGNRVRSVFEQYFSFTHERIAFSISEKGYNHGGEIDGETVAMLGGPAQPDDAPVMKVTADSPVLLRGTIRTTYTGYSWVDLVPKNRYLYFDLTHRSVRDRVFDAKALSPDGAFHPLEAEVEMLDAGTSTLFVPGRLQRFSMDLSNAVYYNSSGEMFMAREVAPGDTYGLQALAPVYGEALRRAVAQGETAGDDRYADLLAAHSDLPEGIEGGVYALTIDLTRDAQNAYDRANAIANYLRRNMRYRLDVDYPPVGRDFVSWFVLDSKVGYCSYFASAMAVMGRIAGLPTRYVEGYLARPGEDGTVTLTGQDAHAWAEVYFRGVGWVPFDATNGAAGFGEEAPGDGGDGDEGEPEADRGGAEDEAQPPMPEDSPMPDDGGQDQPEATPTPEPQSDPLAEPVDAPERPEPPETENDPDPHEDSRAALWIALDILLALLLIALLVLWVRSRLRASDPAVLCGRTKKTQQAAMIAYRANLTLLNRMGQGPVNGETPEAFVTRVAMQFDNPDYERFVRAVAVSRYGNRPVRREDVEAGLSAYRRFESELGRLERLRYAVFRVFHGLGDFEAIP